MRRDIRAVAVPRGPIEEEKDAGGPAPVGRDLDAHEGKEGNPGLRRAAGRIVRAEGR
jgi:hypothetical protein